MRPTGPWSGKPDESDIVVGILRSLVIPQVLRAPEPKEHGVSAHCQSRGSARHGHVRAMQGRRIARWA